ncbi:dihydrofolate reductase [Streptococcus suis]|uniref:dihydrofolate reductase family protein n=1 Tax=Streptococcus suis TaxID=1307 RepID=UPI000CF6C19B|nr:dihydrofolate reductase family protein [Streptococcus suis]MDG4505346.1 dihydrofolate reductase family protein [Streptococcus suis]NQJ71168.1 dihydrofolate reductase [Streptococcus suis]
MARRLVLNIAMSLDGYIARTDGSYDWIEGHGTDQYDTTLQFDNPAFFSSCDTVIMGRKSLEDCPLEMIEGYQEKQFIIASRSEYANYNNVRFVKDIVAEIEQLRAEEGGDIWLFGGASLVQTCLEAGVIDHFIIGIIPIILGEGISLFDGLTKEQKLILVESTVTDGIAMLRYDIRK